MPDNFFDVLNQTPNKSLTFKYRVVFSTDLGREVLADILTNFCHLFGGIDPKNPVRWAEHNVGMEILARLGIFTNESNPIDALTALLNIPYKE